MALVRIPPTRLDLRVARSVASHTNRRAERVAEIVTWGADEKLLFIAVALGWLYCRDADPATRKLSDHVFAAASIAAILPHLMKGLIDQERPDRRTIVGHWHGIPFSGKRYDAFPSGHAVHVGALSSAATLLPRRWQILVCMFGVALVSTRVILLAHWLSDVVAGLAIGAALERALRLVTQPRLRHRSKTG